MNPEPLSSEQKIPSTPAEVTPPPHSKQKSPFLLVGLVVLLLVIVAGTAYSLSKKTNDLVVPPLPPQPSTAANGIEKYENSAAGFSIEYPSTWFSKEFDVTQDSEIDFLLLVRATPISNDVKLTDPWKETQNIEKGLHIIRTKKPVSLPRETGYNCNLDHEGCIVLFKRDLTTFQGLPALQSVAQFPSDPDILATLPLAPYTFTVVDTQGYSWVFAYEHSDFDGNYDKTYDQILSTFEFIENNDSTNNKLRTCPDAWYRNQMPGIVGIPSDPVSKEYFSIDGERRELGEFDIEWIKENCEVNKPTVVS